MKTKRWALISNIILTIVYLLIIYAIHFAHPNDYQFSLYYCLLSFSSLFAVWKNNNGISFFFLFLVTFNLFIGGRFFVTVIDPQFISPFTPTFFYNYNVDIERKISLMNYVYTYLYFLTLSNYFVVDIFKLKLPKINAIVGLNKTQIFQLSKWMYPLLFGVLIIMGLQSVEQAFSAGYGVLDSDRTSEEYSVSILGKFAPMMLIIILALVYVYNPKLLKRYIILYVIYSIIVLISGARAVFGCVILVCIWLYSKTHIIKFKNLFIAGALSIVALLILFSFSSRGSGLDEFQLLDGVKWFAWLQGISLMVFDSCRFYDDYPLPALFQNFIPGFSYILTKFIHIYPQDATMQGYMCYNLNPELYGQGYGLGWTTLSDLYVYSKGNIFIFSILSYFIGCIISALEKCSLQSKFFQYLLITMAPNLLLMSRGPLSILFIQPIYSIFFLVVFIFLFKSAHKCKSLLERQGSFTN